MNRLLLFLVLLTIVTCGSASWLPWGYRQERSVVNVEEVPNNDINILHYNDSTICLRLSASISFLVQYKTTSVQDGIVQVVVPHLSSENVQGSCGPEAFLHISWPSAEFTTAAPTTEAAGTLSLEESQYAESSGMNSLRFDIMSDDDNGTWSYAIANVTGLIYIDNLPEDYPTNSPEVEVSLVDQRLFEAPFDVVAMCSDTTFVRIPSADNTTVVHLVLSDVQLLAYYEDATWPTNAKSCILPQPESEPSNTMAIVVGTSAGVVGVGLVGAFIYYWRTR